MGLVVESSPPFLREWEAKDYSQLESLLSLLSHARGIKGSLVPTELSV